MIGFRSICHVALGGNLPSGDKPPKLTLGHAISLLAEEGLVIRAVSRFFATPCFPAGAGPDYVNAVITVASALEASDVLGCLHRVENQFGREREQRWGARTLDLDLLTCNDQILPDHTVQTHWMDLGADAQRRKAPDQLILPHPRMHERAFVLGPLCDIDPDWRHPVLLERAIDLLAKLPEDEIAAIRPI